MGLEFDAASHTYALDGVVLPSVTQICRYLSVDIAAIARSWLRDAAAERGRRVHEICADIDYGADAASVPADIAGYVRAWAAFERDYGVRDWTMVEHPIASKALGVAGTVDRVGIVDGLLTVADIKTGATVEPAQVIAQCGGYHAILAAKDCTAPFNGQIQRYMSVQLRKDGGYAAKCYEADRTLFFTLQSLDIRRSAANGGCRA